ncbi:TorF family putative porin, partial [Achromobacter xylosoxidans]
ALVALAAPAHAADSATADAPEYTLTANVTLASQYRYRGLMQTNNKPAIQGGFDFTHASGLYLGNWNSSVSWLNDGNSDVSAPVEMDFYGGYKGNLAPDVPFDLGVL